MANEKYKLSTDTHYISNTGHDEKGGTKGGKAGDQGGEYTVRSWYNRPWTVVLRWPDQAQADMAADMAVEAALNNNVGYDQNQRTTFWQQLVKAGYIPANIKTPCEADCTASTAAIWKGVGYRCNVPALKSISTSTTSRNMRARFVAAGFKALTASKYLTSGKYLLPGDVLLYENHHACINITVGKLVRDQWHPSTIIDVTTLGDRPLKNGDTGADVKELQTDLVKLGFDCGKYGADGDFGDATEMAVRDFQQSFGLPVNGVFDDDDFAMMEKALAAADKIPLDAEYVEIVGGNCYIRESPYKEAKAIKVARAGQRIPFGGLINEENGWLYVEYAKDQFGWVSPKYGKLR